MVFNQKGLTFREIPVDLNKMDKKSRVLNATMFKRNETKFISSPGIWKVELTHMKRVMVEKSFLVMPSGDMNVFENQTRRGEWLEYFEKFFNLESFCVKSIENMKRNQSYFHERFFKSCFNLEAKWSSFYPDPKSELDYQS